MVIKTITRLNRQCLTFFKAHLLLCTAALIAVLGFAIYSHQQAFLNLWLTRDQQAMLAFEQGKLSKAAQTFSDESWVAYSFYLNKEFNQAASIYSRQQGTQARFAQANALTLSGQYHKAKAIYQEILAAEPKHQKSINNLAVVNELITRIKKSTAKKSLSTKIAANASAIEPNKKPTGKAMIPSDDLWLEQVQQNPSKFLRKKFQQEYNDENQ